MYSLSIFIDVPNLTKVLLSSSTCQSYFVNLPVPTRSITNDPLKNILTDLGQSIDLLLFARDH